MTVPSSRANWRPLTLSPGVLSLAAVALVLTGCTGFRAGPTGDPRVEGPPLIAEPRAEVGASEMAQSEARGVRLNVRGLDLAAQGRHAEALELYQSALTYVLSPNSSSTITRAAILNNMGVALVVLGRLAEAQPIMAEALQLRQQTLGQLSPLTLLSQANLSVVLLRMGRFKDSCDVGTAAWQGRLRVLGPAHPDTVAVARDLRAIPDCTPQP